MGARAPPNLILEVLILSSAVLAEHARLVSDAVARNVHAAEARRLVGIVGVHALANVGRERAEAPAARSDFKG